MNYSWIQTRKPIKPVKEHYEGLSRSLSWFLNDRRTFRSGTTDEQGKAGAPTSQKIPIVRSIC